MTTILVLDTETTGLIDRAAALDAPHQPHIVQLAWALVEHATKPIELPELGWILCGAGQTRAPSATTP